MRDEKFWTEARVDRLRLLWARQGDDEVSCSAIAAELGTGKNSVVSKVHRLGLPQRANPVRSAGAVKSATPKPVRERRIRVKPVDRFAPKATPAPAPPVAPPMKAEGIGETDGRLDMRYRSNGSLPGCCKFPMWPHDVVKATGPFCNVRIRRADSPYCEPHRAICYEGA